MGLLMRAKEFRVLYVEDDAMVRERMGDILRSFFGEVHEASNGREGLELFHAVPVDIVISDVRMPVMGGLDMCREIRKCNTSIPFLMTSSYYESKELLDAIRINLIDYLIKPYSLDDFEVALTRCLEKLIGEFELISLGPNHAYCRAKQALIWDDGCQIPLSPKEVTMLELMLKNRGRLVSREQIEAVLYGDDYMTEPALKNLIYKLRKKVGKEVLRNVYASGYILD